MGLSQAERSKVKGWRPPIPWTFIISLLISLGIWFVIGHALQSNPSLTLDDARVTALYEGVITLLTLLISIGALTYVEFLSFATRVYREFVDSISNLTADPQTSSLSPSQMRELYVKFGAQTPDDEFLSQPSWEEVARVTQYRVKDVTDIIELQFYGVALFSGLGIIVTLFSFLAQPNLNLVLASIDSGMAAMVFFALLLVRFSEARKSTLDLRPFVVRFPHAKPQV
jgi:hypothetical protein